MINARQTLTGYLDVGVMSPEVEVVRHYLKEKILCIELNNKQLLKIDITDYIDNLTEMKMEAINNMVITVENNDLVFEYDDTVLDLDFSMENKELIVDDRDEIVDFNVNENKELEVAY